MTCLRKKKFVCRNHKEDVKYCERKALPLCKEILVFESEIRPMPNGINTMRQKFWRCWMTYQWLQGQRRQYAYLWQNPLTLPYSFYKCPCTIWSHRFQTKIIKSRKTVWSASEHWKNFLGRRNSKFSLGSNKTQNRVGGKSKEKKPKIRNKQISG